MKFIEKMSFNQAVIKYSLASNIYYNLIFNLLTLYFL